MKRKTDIKPSIPEEEPTQNPAVPVAPAGSAVAVIGSTTLDEIRISGRRIFKMGGATTYAGLTYARFGVPTRILTHLAPDHSWMMARMREAGILPHFGTESPTTVFINTLNGQRRRQEIRSLANPIKYPEISAHITSGDTLHLGPLFPEDIDPGALPLLEKGRFFIVLDIQGYIRRTEGRRVRPAVSEHLAAALRCAHMIKGDQEEVERVLAFFGWSMDRLLSEFNTAEAVVTDGHKGGWIQNRSGALLRFPCEPTLRPKDPTGAGDVFFAAYVAQRRFKGEGIGAAVRTAARIAARHVVNLHIHPRILMPPSPEGFLHDGRTNT